MSTNLILTKFQSKFISGINLIYLTVFIHQSTVLNLLNSSGNKINEIQTVSQRDRIFLMLLSLAAFLISHAEEEIEQERQKFVELSFRRLNT